MNKFQKNVLTNFFVVIVLTSVAVLAMINLKDYVNRSEAMRTMTQLGQHILQYRKENGSIPPRSYIDRITEGLSSSIRLGRINYRARWIDFDSPGDEILAYVEQNYNSLLIHSGCVVLRLDGTVEWMDKNTFYSILQKQLKPAEQHLLEIELETDANESSS